MDIKLKRCPGIYIAGFAGSGKPAVGRMLADRLGWDFADLDAEIEAEEGATIAKTLEKRGEPEFRRIETAMMQKWVRRIERGVPAVLALGEGAFVQPGNFDLIENHGISLWLDCGFEDIDRRAGYSKADFRIERTSDAQTAVQAILDLPIWK